MPNTDPSRPKRYIAIIGGSFDPIHNGHLYLAEKLSLDPEIEAVAFLPVGNHNFKKDKLILSFEQRLQLIRKALQPGAEVWLDDASGSGYTADLMRRLQGKYPDKHFAFVIGSDNLEYLHLWYDFEWLKENVTFLIVPRVGYELQQLDKLGINYLIKDIRPPGISSSAIRSNIAQGLSIAGLVPQEIESQVRELYESEN
ncbi:MAG TPA: nicotinate (nicotinamide) nucleotide adenylyltransferase [Candidatus Cloacimonadota bacterium]|nr:nicotinate (nicotinamide) nucleotide adenylyltransferase [Candidatus Cloacimonadota bacterium]